VGDSRALGAGPVLWCLKRPDLYGPGLMAHGLDPALLVLVGAPRDDAILWAMEEGLRTQGLAAVVGEIGRLPMVAGRRLQLAAERSGVTALVLRRWRNGEEAARERERPSAALTRWRVASLPSFDEPRLRDDPRLRHLIGRPRWRVELLRCRGGVPALWNVEVADATGHVCLSAELADRPAAAIRREADRFDAEPERRRTG
jgi:protein ImuA